MFLICFQIYYKNLDDKIANFSSRSLSVCKNKTKKHTNTEPEVESGETRPACRRRQILKHQYLIDHREMCSNK